MNLAVHGRPDLYGAPLCAINLSSAAGSAGTYATGFAIFRDDALTTIFCSFCVAFRLSFAPEMTRIFCSFYVAFRFLTHKYAKTRKAKQLGNPESDST